MQQDREALTCSNEEVNAAQAPAYLSDNINLVMDSGCHLLQSAANVTCIHRTAYMNGGSNGQQKHFL